MFDASQTSGAIGVTLSPSAATLWDGFQVQQNASECLGQSVVYFARKSSAFLQNGKPNGSVVRGAGRWHRHKGRAKNVILVKAHHFSVLVFIVLGIISPAFGLPVEFAHPLRQCGISNGNG